MFVGRKKELDFLNERYNSQKAEFIVLYGRRRIGKTELIHEFIKDKKSIFFMSTLDDTNAQLKSLSHLISTYNNNNMSSAYTFDDWESCFNKLYDLSANNRLIFVMDEFPNLVKRNNAIPSILQKVWDLYLKNSKIMIIISGSSMSFIENELLAYNQPLYGRATSIYKLQPLSYIESAQFVKNYSVENKISTYAICGGTPLYLSLFDDSKSIKENICNNILKKSGQLHDEVEFLLRQELREISVYNNIIKSIACGAHRFNEILLQTQIGHSQLSTYLNTLMNLQYIKKELPQNSPLKNQINKDTGLYEICDDFFRFYYKFCFPNLSLLYSESIDIVYDELIQPYIHSFVSKTFENICIDYLYQQNNMKKLPAVFLSFKRWWGKTTKVDINKKPLTKNEEIDILGYDIKNKEILIGECKFTNSLFDNHQFNEIKHKIETDKKIDYYLFSLNGFSDELKHDATVNENIHLIAADMLYKS